MPPLIDIDGLVTGALPIVAASLAAFGCSVPTLQYVHAGDLALDEDAFVVWASAIDHGTPGQPTPGVMRTDARWSLTVNFTLIRTYNDDGQVIVPGGLESALGHMALQDAGYLLSAIIQTALIDKTLFGTNLQQIGPFTWVGPSGANVATTVPVVTEL